MPDDRGDGARRHRQDRSRHRRTAGCGRAATRPGGREPARLRDLADAIGGEPRTVVADSVDAVVREVTRSAPSVVVDTIGPFTDTAPPIARACPPGTHYVDLANELPAVTEPLGTHDDAAATGRCVVTGAGFGVLATESVVLKLCADRPRPARVRVDALTLVEAGADTVGSALAASLVDTLAYGGRRYEQGRLVRTRLGSDLARLRLPGGEVTETAGMPSGELESARRASGAPAVVAATSLAPTGRATRAVLPAVAALLSCPPLRTVAKRLLARARVSVDRQDREHSLAHARVDWSDGSTSEGWLRADDGMTFTAAVAAEVANRLARGDRRPGAYPPGALFGPGLAEAAGGRFVLDLSTV